MGQFCERVKNKSSTERQEALQGALLLSLNEDCKGLYSVFHDNAIEKYGYDDPKAIRLAYMLISFGFCDLHMLIRAHQVQHAFGCE